MCDDDSISRDSESDIQKDYSEDEEESDSDLDMNRIIREGALGKRIPMIYTISFKLSMCLKIFNKLYLALTINFNIKI